LTAQVARDLQRTIFKRHKALWAQKSNAELQYLQAKRVLFGGGPPAGPRPAEACRSEPRSG
jgi:hypothetical protein